MKIDKGLDILLKSAVDLGYTKAYICGAISSIGYDKAKEEFGCFSDKVQKYGLIPFSTFSQPQPKNREKDVYVKDGVKIMMDCDVLVAMDSALLSKNALKQIEVAKIVGIPVIKNGIL